MSLLSLVVFLGAFRVLHVLSGDVQLDLKGAGEAVSLNLTSLVPSRSVEIIPLSAEKETQQPSSAHPVQDRAEIAVVTPAVRGGEVDLTFGGTIALETSVRQSGYYADSKRYDFTDLLSIISSQVTGDYAMAAMENLVVPSEKVSDLIAPEEVMGMLVSGGFDGLALGFARVYDKGMDGISGTVLAAQSAGLEVTGGYIHEGDAALTSHIHTMGNVKVAVLHYTDALTSTGKKNMKKDGNTYAVSLLDRAEQDIAIVREMGADLVVVSVHWGTEGKTDVTSAQKSAAERLALAGADLIIGNGPRRVQRVEYLETATDGKKHRTLCAYSLGCLLSSSNQSQALQSVLLHVHASVDADGQVTLKASYTPAFIWRYKQENVLRFRVIASDGPVPDGMKEDQQKKMANACSSVRKILADFPYDE